MFSQSRSIAAEKNITDEDNIEYVPVLSKGFDSYYDQNEQDAFKADMAKIPEKTKDLSFKNVFSITPGGGIIDTGFKNPFGDDTLKFSNPPSQLQNLGPFFNLAESFGYQNFKDSYNTDVSQSRSGSHRHHHHRHHQYRGLDLWLCLVVQQKFLLHP